MRPRQFVIYVVIAVVAAIAFSVTGQEEPLPPVMPRGVTIALPIEPQLTTYTPTLSEAASANDYVTFDALFNEARRRGQPIEAYETLHELWTWSMNDPIGAFYGPDLYARLARAYPGYREFIDEHRIIDSNGNAFYPTSETRAFLLARAMEGRAPRVMVAERAPVVEPKTAPAGSRRPALNEAERPGRQAAGAPKAVVAPKVAASVAKVEQAAPAASPDPIITEPPVVITPAPAPALAPVQIAEAAPKPAPVVPVEPQKTNNLAGRGLLLVIVGLIGVGLLAVILRTPPEDTVTPRRAP